MIFFFLLVPVLLVFLALKNLMKNALSAKRIAVGIVITYSIILVTVAIVSFIPFELAAVGDILGNLIIVFFIMLFLYWKTKDLLQSAFYSMVAMIISMIGNTMATILVNQLFESTTDDIRSSLFLHVILIIITFPLCFIISRYIGNRLHELQKSLSVEVNARFVVYGSALAAITFLLSHINIFAYRMIDNSVLLSSINVVLITLVFIVALIVMTAYSKSQQLLLAMTHEKNSLEEIARNHKLLEQAYDEMRNFRHDHLNLLSALVIFTEEDKNENLKLRLIENINYTEDILKKLDISMDRLKYIHIPELKSLLAIKLAYALARDIHVELDIAEPVAEIPINKIDLCRLVGIIVDNAIEALETMENEEKNLQFGILLDDEDILIICTNTCKKPVDATQIFEKGYSTKGFGRGIGLYSLKQTSEKCGNVLVTVRSHGNKFGVILTVRKE